MCWIQAMVELAGPIDIYLSPINFNGNCGTKREIQTQDPPGYVSLDHSAESQHCQATQVLSPISLLSQSYTDITPSSRLS